MIYPVNSNLELEGSDSVSSSCEFTADDSDSFSSPLFKNSSPCSTSRLYSWTISSEGGRVIKILSVSLNQRTFIGSSLVESLHGARKESFPLNSEFTSAFDVLKPFGKRYGGNSLIGACLDASSFT